MKIIFSTWFTHLNRCMGLVVIEDEITEERKAYIGVLEHWTDEQSDSEFIAKTGAKFSLEIALTLVNILSKGI